MAGAKMTSLAILSLILSFFLCVSTKEPVPVLLWQSFSGSSLNSPSSALKSESSTEFSDFLLKKITDSKPLLLVFGEKSLSVEDFTWLGTEEKRPFPKLEKLYSSAKSRLYIPDVNSPLTALHNLKEHDYQFEDVQMGDDIPGDGKHVVFVNLDSERPGESRLEMLRRHDSYITSVYSQLSSKHPALKVLALYTGQSPSWSNGDLSDQSVGRTRSRRAVNDNSTVTFYNDTANNFYVYSPSSIVLTVKGQSYNLPTPVSITGDLRASGPSKLAARYPLVIANETQTQIQFVFYQSDGMWNLSQVNVNYDGSDNVLTSKEEITAPLGFSYHCTRTEVFQKGDVSVSLKNPQIQPFVGNGTFGTPYDCVYFFTVSILSGLLLTVLLLAITAWGITMIMDIHTMDRFDDPKGKPLFISAQE